MWLWVLANIPLGVGSTNRPAVALQGQVESYLSSRRRVVVVERFRTQKEAGFSTDVVLRVLVQWNIMQQNLTYVEEMKK